MHCYKYKRINQASFIKDFCFVSLNAIAICRISFGLDLIPGGQYLFGSGIMLFPLDRCYSLWCGSAL